MKSRSKWTTPQSPIRCLDYDLSPQSRDQFTELLGQERCSRILDHGIDLDRSLIVSDSASLVDVSLQQWIRSIENLKGICSTLIVMGDLTSNGHVAIEDHYLIVLGTLTCESFANHGDAGEFIGHLKANRFVSLASHNTDMIDRLEAPHCFEWDDSVIRSYAPGTTVYFEPDALQKGASAVVEADDIEGSLPKLVLNRYATAKGDEEPNQRYWELRADLDRFVAVLMECGGMGEPS